MRARLAALGVLLGGCDVVFGLAAPALDGGSPADARVCDAGTPFAGGNKIDLGAYSVEGARLSADQSDAYLSLCTLIEGQNTPSEIRSRCQLYTSRYDAASMTFAFFTELGSVSQDGTYDSYPTFTPDTSYLVFGSSRSGSVQLYAAMKVDGRFDTAPVRLPLPTLGMNANEPYLLADGRTLYLQASSGVLTPTLFRAVGDAPTFDIGAAAPINDLEVYDDGTSSLGEFAPVVREDERELFYASGDIATAGLDIFTSTRAFADAPFAAPTRLPALSAGGNDWPVWLSPDGCTLYYVNKGVDGIGQLLVTRR